MAGDNQALLLQVSADLRKLEGSFDRAAGKVDKSSTFMERRSRQLAQKLEQVNKIDVGAAVGKVVDSTRLRVLDTGVARIGLFGSALEPLGPLGLAAAAGIGAFAAALAGASAAAKFAGDIADTAKRLHVTTDALQEYRYAIRAAGGEEKGADEALESFSTNLGLAQAGLKKAQRGFIELGFTKAQIKGFTDADDALKNVVGRISGLSNVQKDAVIRQLGLEGIKPLIDDGAEAMARLRQEAHSAGLVMDAELVKRGGELNDKFETARKVIDVQLKSALVDLGPVLLDLLTLAGQLARFAADTADSFRSIEDKSNRGLDHRLQAIQNRQAAFIKQLGPLAFLDPKVQGAIKTGDFKGLSGAQLDFAHLGNEARQIEGQRTKRTGEATASAVTATSSLIDTSKSGSSKAVEDPFKAINAFAKLDEQIKKMLFEDSAKAFGDAFKDFNERGDQGINAQVVWAQRLQEVTEESFEKAFKAFLDSEAQGQNAQVVWEQQGKALQESLHDGVYGGIRGALQALADGDILEYFASALERALLDATAESLTKLFLQAAAPHGIGNGGFLATAAKFIGIPGFASGTNFAPGGPAWVGEHGRELVNLPRGSQVIPSHALRNVTMPARAPGPSILEQHLHFDMRGALTPAELLSQAQRTAQFEANRVGVRVLKTANEAAPGRMTYFQRHGI